MSDLCDDVSSISSFHTGPDINCETPDVNHIDSEPVFSRANPCSSGSVFSEVHERMANRDNVISNSEPTSYHPEHQRLLDALKFMSQHQTPIDHAYFVNCINDYLKEVITKKENKLKKRALDESFASNATSIVNHKFQAIQDQYQSFYGSNSTLNRIQPNLTDHSFAPYHNGSILPISNSDRSSRVQSSFINKSRNNLSAISTNNVGRPLKFSKLEDTFGSVRCNGESFVQNNSLFQNLPGPSTRAPTSFKPTGFRSTIFTKSRNNLSSFQSNNSLQTTMNGHNDTGRPNDTIDQFSCVRVLVNKAQLPPVIEEQQQCEESDESSNESTSVSSIKESNDQGRTAKNSSKKDSLPNDQFILKNWTVLLKNNAMHLKGMKLIGEKIVEKTHTSEEIAYRLRDGKIKTKDESLYKLIDPFIANEEMPPKVKAFFRNNKFPLNWRVALKAWMAELENRKLEEMESKIKPCHVVLEYNGVSKYLKNSKVEKKINKAQDKEEKKRVTKKFPSKSKSNVESSSVKKDTPPKVKKNIPPKVKNNTPPKVKKTKKNPEQISENESPRKKSNKKIKEKSQVNKKENVQAVKKNKAQAKQKNIHQGKSQESSPRKKRKENSQTQKNDEAETALADKVETGDVNFDCDLFGEIVKTPLNRDRNVCTPTALLNSIKKNVPKQVGRYTPPLKIMSDFIKKKKTLNLADISISCGSKENPVIKRMAKAKVVKKISKKENPLDCSKDDEINQILATLVNKSPQTTPKAIKQVFRKNEDSDIVSDFGSDISSISS